MEYVYPRKPYVDSSKSRIPDSEIAEIIIACREAGDSKIMAELHALATAKCPSAVKKVSRQIDEDIENLKAVDALKYSTVTEYVDALRAASVYIPVTTWAAYLQDKYDIPDGTAAERFAALKVALTNVA